MHTCRTLRGGQPAMCAESGPKMAISRRSLLAAAAAAMLPASAALGQQGQVPPSPAGQRVALLIGNRYYPDGQDLPSMHANVRQLQRALEQLGFRCTAELDLDRAGSLRAIDRFARELQAMPPDTVSLFYFCGHGMQIDAENFLLPARVYPRERALNESRTINVELGRDVREPLPRRAAGLSIAVIDACRTSPKSMAADDGLNQVRAAPGELVVFSTGAGRPALAPLDENRLTFYTEALVRRLEALHAKPDELTFPDMFRLVGSDVQRTMRAHPVEDIRELTQVPFIADNSGLPFRVALRSLEPAVAPGTKAEDAARQLQEEQVAFEQLRGLLWPKDVQRASAEFIRRYPESRYANATRVSAEGAVAGAGVLSSPDISLERADFQPRPEFGVAFNEDLRRASRGDKDAAARVAERLRSRETRGPEAQRYEGWMQYAAELGNGIAAYDLARYYNAIGLASLAGRWGSRAKQLGYVPPPSLRITR